jgi:phage tail sheath protein FI
MVRRLAAGFSLHDADTLSNESDWRQINVRRLMILLRRVALRRGMTYVFESNGPVLRRAVERDLVQMLDDMQRRGAFAGKTSAQSWRVAVQDDAGDRDNGRLVVEIAVAPAQPMRFLTLRLVQRGSRLTILEEA